MGKQSKLREQRRHAKILNAYGSKLSKIPRICCSSSQSESFYRFCLEQRNTPGIFWVYNKESEIECVFMDIPRLLHMSDALNAPTPPIEAILKVHQQGKATFIDAGTTEVLESTFKGIEERLAEATSNKYVD